MCLCTDLDDLSIIDMGCHEEIFATLMESKKRGLPWWWLSHYVCRDCNQGWLVAQEERHNDVFCMKKLDRQSCDAILNANTWPADFDRYETLLRLGRDAGCGWRWDDPMNSSMVQTVIDLAMERPGIRVSELMSLLGLDRPLAEAMVQRAQEQEKVQIEPS